MLKPTDEYKSQNFTATLSDDPSGIWYLNVSCVTEKNGQKGRVIGHIPLCLTMEEDDDGELEAVLSLMDDRDDDDDDKEITFPGSK